MFTFFLSGQFDYFPGENYGYDQGGFNPFFNNIEKYSFTADGNSTDVGDLTVARTYMVGQCSNDYGYTTGGRTASDPLTHSNVIDKHSFTIDGNATDVGDLSIDNEFFAGTSAQQQGYGYKLGGQFTPNHMDKFSFTVDGNATDIGDLVSSGQSDGHGGSSPAFGYIPTAGRNLEKHSFSTDSNAVDIGNMQLVDTTSTHAHSAGCSSFSDGYHCGGFSGGIPLDERQKYSFSTDADAVLQTGVLSVARQAPGSSSTTHGYVSGSGDVNGVIDKFSFSTDANSTDVGDQVVERDSGAGSHY